MKIKKTAKKITRIIKRHKGKIAVAGAVAVGAVAAGMMLRRRKKKGSRIRVVSARKKRKR